VATFAALVSTRVVAVAAPAWRRTREKKSVHREHIYALDRWATAQPAAQSSWQGHSLEIWADPVPWVSTPTASTTAAAATTTTATMHARRWTESVAANLWKCCGGLGCPTIRRAHARQGRKVHRRCRDERTGS
jgi:hypothetical protein